MALPAISTAVPVANAADTVDKTHISAADLEELIAQGTAPTIIDVRSGYEYRAGYTEVLYLDEHMSGWYKAGLAIEK